jgi:hypothetical protein
VKRVKEFRNAKRDSSAPSASPLENDGPCDQDCDTVREQLASLGMDNDGNFVAYDPSVDMQYIKDWLDQPANNGHVRIVDIAAVTTEMVTPESKDMPGDQPTIISTNYDLHNGDVSYVFAEASDHPESYSEVDTSIAGLTWHHNPTTQDTIVTVDLPLFLKHTSGTPVAATATVSPLRTKPDTASQRPPPPSANHVPPPTKSERLLYNLTDILDENGIPLLHMTDKFKEVISREDPDLQDLHQHVIDSGVTASSDAQGLPALDKMMKSVEPNEFERKNSMHLPLAPGTSRLPAPQYRKQSHADLEISAATIRAFFAQGWIYKCKSPTMAPIHLVPKPPKAGINPATGKPYPARRRRNNNPGQCSSAVMPLHWRCGRSAPAGTGLHH